MVGKDTSKLSLYKLFAREGGFMVMEKKYNKKILKIKYRTTKIKYTYIHTYIICQGTVNRSLGMAGGTFLQIKYMKNDRFLAA